MKNSIRTPLLRIELNDFHFFRIYILNIKQFRSKLYANIYNPEDNDMSLTKRDIAMKMAKKLDMTQQEALAAIQFTLDTIKEELLNDGNVELRNFGVFEVAIRAQKIGRNPNRPKQEFIIPAQKVIKFRTGKEIKDKLNSEPE